MSRGQEATQKRLTKDVRVPIRRKSVDGEAFSSDWLDRSHFAECLTEHVADFAKGGGVIVLDAPWGTGKSWFAENWCAQLKESGHTAHYVDCFARDYLEDAFLLIASEIIEMAGAKDDSKSLKRAAFQVGRTLAPALLRVGGIALNAVVPGAGGLLDAGMADKITDAFADASEKAFDKYLEERLENAHKAHQTVSHFREVLEAFAKDQDKPVVLVVDELDRCKPSFAVQFIERLKHFFEVPNLVIVMVTSIQQMEAYVCGVYGSNVDASGYLRKFYRRVYSLPEINSRGELTSTAYARRLLIDAGLTDVDYVVEVWDAMQIMAPMTLREVEHSVLVISGIDGNGWESWMAPLLIYLGIKRPSIFLAIRDANGSPKMREDFRSIMEGPLNQFADRSSRGQVLLFHYLIALVRLSGNQTTSLKADEIQALEELRVRLTYSRELSTMLHAMRRAINKIAASEFSMKAG